MEVQLKTKGDMVTRPDNFLLSVVVPCFNEHEVITITYRQLIDVLGGRNFRLQIVFVDDGSADQTPYLAVDLANRDPRVAVVMLSRNFGHQAAVSAGLANADGDAIAVMDADLQDPPEVVLQMIDKWRQGADVVYGIRTGRKEPLIKRTAYNISYRVFRKLSDVNTPLDAGDFSLIDRKVLDVINQLSEKNRFFRGLRAWSGFRQAGVPYERHIRAAGSTKSAAQADQTGERRHFQFLDCPADDSILDRNCNVDGFIHLTFCCIVFTSVQCFCFRDEDERCSRLLVYNSHHLADEWDSDGQYWRIR